MADITVGTLTESSIAGAGVFDVLMRATKAHLDEEFKANRIRGPEYSTVYLGSIQAVMQTSLQFVLSQQKANLEAQLLEKQIALADKELLKAQAAIDLTNQQKANLILEADNIPKQGALIDAQKDVQAQQKLNLAAEKLSTDAKTALVTQQTTNATTENLVLQAQKCKLDAEFDVLTETKLKTASETSLLTQKIATEKAQILASGVEADSVVGRQKGLYAAQTAGFQRDAEQKAAKLLADTWNARRMTDDATSANADNKLNDATIGRAITKLLDGIGA